MLRPVRAPEPGQDLAPRVVGRVHVLRSGREALQSVGGPVRREPLALQLAGELLDLLAERRSLQVEEQPDRVERVVPVFLRQLA